jgi:high affinity sulfate transporter 1
MTTEGATARSLVDRYVPAAVWIRSYRPRRLPRDLIAALTVWAIVVPQSLAYASLAGVPPGVGLEVALVASLAYAVLGTCRQLNVGPSSSVAITSAVAVAPLAGGDPDRFLELSALLALSTGAILLVAGLARLGSIADFFARPVLSGFVFGLAGVIIIGQAPKLFGVPGSSGNAFEQVVQLMRNIGDTSGRTLTLGAACLAAMLVMARVMPRLPAALITVAGATLVVHLLSLDEKGVPIIGDIPAELPSLAWPGLSLGDFQLLAGPAAGLALLAFAESIGAARTIAARHDYQVDPHQELVALGAANMTAGLTSGFACDASLSRSSVADQGGQVSQLAGVALGVLTLLTILFLTPLFHDLPDAALAAVIIAAVLPLLDTARFRYLFRVDRADFTLAVVSAGAVLLVGVLFGILTAIVASLLALVYRGYRPHRAVLGLVPHERGDDESFAFRNTEGHPDYITFPGLVIYRFDSELFFANASLFCGELRRLADETSPPVRTILVDASAITHIDTTAADMLTGLIAELRAKGVDLALARVRGKLRAALERNGVLDDLGEQHVHFSLRTAVTAVTTGSGTQTG